MVCLGERCRIQKHSTTTNTNIYITRTLYYIKKRTAQESTECNYEIYDKDLPAIIRFLEHWRPQLEATGFPIEIVTDDRSLDESIEEDASPTAANAIYARPRGINHTGASIQ